MRRHALLFSIFTAAMFTVPAFAAANAPDIVGTRWGRNAFNFEPMPSGPQPVRNLSRLPDGTGNAERLVGDYHNPILKPEAAAVVKQKGDLAIAGKSPPNASDQCRLYAPPFTFALQLGFQILPENDGNLTIIYRQDDNVRHVRMNATHPAKLVPSRMGDSVGRWEGNVLVIDTIGIKSDAFTTIDRSGTPQSDAMHVIERYRLIDGALAVAAQDKYLRAEGGAGGGNVAGVDPDTSVKGLLLELTIEDANVFTMPLTALVTYRHLITEWQEMVCAENPIEYYKDQWIGLPKADRPDF